MNVIQTGLRDCVVIEPNVFSDERGFFLETFHAGRYADIAGIDTVPAGQSFSLIQGRASWITLSKNKASREVSSGGKW